MATIRDIVFDCAHPASLARFWAAVLDGYDIAPYDDAELERLHQLGITGTEDDPGVLVVAGPGRPRLYFQRVPESKTVKNRVHIDVDAADHAAELERLRGLGARVLGDFPEWTTMADPEGNEFCVMKV
ncbi:VOC family protein [Allonocardiopsis opalescens]|uniref:Glyoxalase-like domain-containing protein n=1 Tax=Allonocardiopsis opalescens TaxID=1144618 RepID=A0A2T0Q561_9ACTN|nr:VOC family protein [Allonocardiopsis opalescens]PRX98909.1 hypothetical protein CLV72_104489 [Allonocardiopsis opalescens]